MGKSNDLTGLKFHKLTVIKKVDKPTSSKTTQRGTWWECQCECGNKTVVIASQLRDKRENRQTKSCGCLKSPKYWENKRYKGVGKLAQSHWSHIKYCATVSRNIEFNITIEYAWDLFLKQNGKCFYTGDEIFLNSRNGKEEITASLDRIDSSKGYIEGNVVWCRKDINIMKNDKSYIEFLDLCNKVAKYSVKTHTDLNYLFCEDCGAIDNIYSGQFYRSQNSSETIHMILCGDCVNERKSFDKNRV